MLLLQKWDTSKVCPIEYCLKCCTISDTTTELKRSFNLLSMIGFCFSIVTCWSALSGVLIVGVESGGPPVMVCTSLAITKAKLTLSKGVVVDWCLLLQFGCSVQHGGGEDWTELPEERF